MTKGKLILGIDTAGPTSQVVLAEVGKIIDQKTWSEPFSQSEKTLVYIDQLLMKNSRKKEQLLGIIVNQGPTDSAGNEASFTGLKIGTTIGNGIGFCLQIPIVGVSLKGQKFSDIIEKTDLEDQKRGFIRPKYSKAPNITKKGK